MGSVSIVPALLRHADALAPILRASDRAEIWASSRQEPLECLRNAMGISEDSWSAFAGDQILAIFGVVDQQSFGVPWMLASNHLRLHPRAALVLGRRIVLSWLAEYGQLQNFVDARQTASIRWLRKLGFTIEPPRPLGPDHLPFHLFHREAADV